VDPGFGNHPALLALTQNGHPSRTARSWWCLVTGPRSGSCPGVSRLTVGIATTPATDTSPAAGSPAEQLAGGRPLQLSLNEDGVALAQPRLVTDGDVKGGRYISGVVDIYVGAGPAH
jgi:hypothetical protein